VELRLLRYSLAVAEERHTGRAAIRQLENELGATLLDRTPHGVAPTAAGEALGGRAPPHRRAGDGWRFSRVSQELLAGDGTVPV
jgi:hypothetical protein